MTPIKVLDSHNAKEAAEVIFHYFEPLQNCAIRGYEYVVKSGVRVLKPKGELVCDHLTYLDRIHNTRTRADGKIERKVKRHPDSIGGYAAHKIFRFKKVIDNEEPKYTIWRIQ